MGSVRNLAPVVVAYTAAWLVSVSLAHAAPVAPPAPEFGWLFDDGAGTNASAFAGGADASLENGTDWSTDTPLAYSGNMSLVLDGNDDFVDVPGLSTVLNGVSAFTLSFWVRSASTGVDRAFWGGVAPGNDDTFGGRYDAAGWLPGNDGTTNLLKFALGIDGVEYQYEASGGLQTTSWQHVIFSWSSGSGVAIWIDGIRDTASAMTPGLATATGTATGQNQFLIGDGAKANWNGGIDEVMLWRTSLSDDNISYLAQGSLSPAFIPAPEPGAGTLLLVGAGVFAALRRGVDPIH